ncbi:MAG: TlpA family protein disulfide reductase [Muribaculaceae bacterium]|nr:TlpA family protein disulfide reductase [Muribaculaceae bacterium]
MINKQTPINMKPIIALSTLIISAASFTAAAQTINVTVTAPKNEAYKNVVIFASPSQSVKAKLLGRDGNIHRADIKKSPSGFYIFVMNDKVNQVTFPMYLEGDTCSFALTSPKMESINDLTDNVNRALTAYRNTTGQLSTEDTDNSESLKANLNRYISCADSIAKAYKLNDKQAEFMRLWGATNAYNTAQNIEYQAQRTGKKLDFSVLSLLPDPASVLDCPEAMWFKTTPYTVMKTLKGSTPEEKLAELFNKYETPEIRDRVKINIASNFVDKYDYANNYEGGRQRLEDMIARYDLPSRMLDDYKSHLATLPGTPFPEDVILTDPEGNTVPFSKFLGKYVYVDMWASWCGPCRAEVPYLQELEKTLGRDDVEFVSISIDTNKQAWLDRMKELNMHGNQLLDADSALGEKLNVRAIPHFLLYGPDGKIITYKTSRPSAAATRKMLLELPKL